MDNNQISLTKVDIYIYISTFVGLIWLFIYTHEYAVHDVLSFKQQYTFHEGHRSLVCAAISNNVFS